MADAIHNSQLYSTQAIKPSAGAILRPSNTRQQASSSLSRGHRGRKARTAVTEAEISFCAYFVLSGNVKQASLQAAMPILAAQPSCLCRPEIFCPFRAQTFFPEPCAMYECVYSRAKRRPPWGNSQRLKLSGSNEPLKLPEISTPPAFAFQKTSNRSSVFQSSWKSRQK
jgi:hypothetical protein